MSRPVFKSGNLREAITVQRRSNTPDGFGNVNAGWVTIGSGIPAQISPLKGGEQVRSGRMAGVSKLEIVVRSDSSTRGIRISDQLLNGRTGQAYDVKHVANLDERDQWLVLSAVAVT